MCVWRGKRGADREAAGHAAEAAHLAKGPEQLVLGDDGRGVLDARVGGADEGGRAVLEDAPHDEHEQREAREQRARPQPLLPLTRRERLPLLQGLAPAQRRK